MSLPAPDVPQPPKQNPAEVFFSDLGPGLITGCADDDPSGISTYSITGAAFGYGLLWTALISFPLMVAVQMMCGRLGMVTGRGLAGVIRRRYSKWILWGACALLIVANVVNIAADLGGMADATRMITGVNALVWTPLLYGAIVGLLVLFVVPSDRTHLQMADAGAAGLRHHRLLRVCRLAPGAARHAGASRGLVARLCRGAGGDSRHHHLSLSVLLAGLAGSGRGTRHGQESGCSARAPPKRNSGHCAWMWLRGCSSRTSSCISSS